MPWDDLTTEQQAFLDKHFTKRFSDIFTKRSKQSDNVEKTSDYELALSLDTDLGNLLATLPNDYQELKAIAASRGTARKAREKGDFKTAIATLRTSITEVNDTIDVYAGVVGELRLKAASATDVPGIDGDETKTLTGIGGEILALIAALPIPLRSDLDAARLKAVDLDKAKEVARAAVEKRRIRKAFDDAFAKVKDALEKAEAVDPAPFAKVASHGKLVTAIAKAKQVLADARLTDASDDSAVHAKTTLALDDIAKSPTVEDLRLDCEKELEERKRKVAAIGVERQKLQAEITRLGKLPEDTAEAARHMLAITMHNTRLPKLVTAEDLEGAEDIFKSLKDAIAAMQGEEVALGKAGTLREAALDEFDKMSGDLKKARAIFEIDASFKTDVESFKAWDNSVQFNLHAKNYAKAMLQIDRLKPVMAKLLSRKGEFDQLVRERAAASLAAQRFYKLVPEAKKTALLKPEAVTARARVDEVGTKIEQLYKAKVWAELLALCNDGIKKANALIALKGECDLQANELKAQNTRFGKAVQLVKPELGKEEVDPEFIAQLVKIRASEKEWKALVAKGDLVASAVELGQFETLCKGLAPTAKKNDEAITRRDEVFKTYTANKVMLEDVWQVKPATDKMLALKRKADADYKAFTDVYSAGPVDLADLLDAAIASAQACLDERTEDNKHRVKAQKAYEKRQKAVEKEAIAAVGICDANAPDLATPRSEVVLPFNNAVDLAAKGLFVDALEGLEKAATAAARVAGLVAGAQSKMNDRKVDFQNRYAKPLKDKFVPILSYEDVAPGLMADVTIARNLNADITLHEINEEWVEGLSKLAQLEAKVDDLTKRKADHDKRVVDRDWLVSERAKVQSNITTAGKMKAVDREIEAAVTRYARAAAVSGAKAKPYTYAEARAGFPEFLDAMNGLIALKLRHDQLVLEREKVDKAFGPMAANRTTASEMKGITPEFAKLVAAYTRANDLLMKHYNGHDYASALTALPALAKASKALADKKVQYDQLLLQAKTDATRAESDIDTETPANLKKKTSDEKLTLLNALRGAKEELTPEQRKQQRKIYMALDLDEDFLKVDEPRRGKLIDAIKQDKELFAARDTWASEPVEKKIALLQKTLKTECELYDMPVPKIITFEEPPGDLGSFNSGTGTISINIHPEATFDDFHDTIDTIVHENAHNYQAHLVKKLEDGLLMPGDPEYKQALMFAANSEPFAYVTGEEDRACYKKEPLEEHAWKTGGDVQEALKKAPPTI